ncbi:MAG: PVC-type heme-binding CxxCH protein [Verrucomicrobiota bacterium]
MHLRSLVSRTGFRLCATLLCLWNHSTASGAPSVAFKADDVVVLTGGANIERTRFNGHLHTLLVSARPELRLRVRNLGWEGDTVFEQWRDYGGEQWRRSRDWSKQLGDIGADVVLAQFGQMESLQGAAKLADFVAAYEKLLDQFAAEGRQIVLLSPMPFEKTVIETLPDLSAHNGEVKQYADAIRDLAQRRGMHFVDLFTPFANRSARSARMTDNGYHLNDDGHALVAEQIVRQFGLKPKPLKSLEPVRVAAVELERLWFDFWRPMNWSFLEGDRTHVPFSRDWRDQDVRLFPEEMKEFVPLIQQAEENVRRALAKEPIAPLGPRSPIPVMPPSAPPQTPEEELASLKILPDFEVSLFASEKDGIVKPIQMRWDERGRLWVACTISYPQVKPGEKANDRIMICEDTNGDGRADKFSTFVEGLFMPTGLELGDGGLYVAQGTELMHFRDTNGDGRADEKRIVLGGFGTADSHQMINCISWGFGGELWFTQGHHIYSRVETPHGVEHLNRAGVWRYRPRTMQLDPFFQMSSAGANCWGVVTDDYGQVFHKSGATIGGYYCVPGLIRTDLALDSEIMRVFQARAKQVGFDIIDSRHFPDELQGMFVIGGYYDNTLQLHRLDQRNGVYVSKQLPPIIETTNTVFRPVDVHLGPDGAIYFADWYNPIIGHYQASYRHPDRDKSHGRIWRVSYKGRAPVKPPQLAGASIEELLRHLDSSERWVKYQAKRLLFEQKSSTAVASLDRWVKTLKPGDAHDDPLRLRALGVYESHETVRPQLLASLLRSPDYRVRAYATRALGHWNARLPDARKILEQQIADEHPRVRLEAVVAASYFADSSSITIAARALDRPVDAYIDYALTKAAHALRPLWEPALNAGQLQFTSDNHLLFVLKNGGLPDAAAFIRRFAQRTEGNAARLRPWLNALASVGNADDLRFVLDRAQSDPALLDALAVESETRKLIPAGDVQPALEKLSASSSAALQQRAVRLAGVWRVQGFAEKILALAQNNVTETALRIEAFDSLARLRGKDALPLLARVAEQETKAPLALGALEAVARINLPQAAALATKRLGSAANAQESAQWLRPILQSRGGYVALAKALPDGSLAPAQARMSLSVVNNAGRFDKVLVARLSKLAGFSADLPVYSPEFVRDLATRAQREGDAARGRQVYDMMGCAACHVVNGEGGKVGPDISALGRGQPIDGIITELIWPQLNVKEGFEAVRVLTKDGRNLEGVKQSETAGETAIRDTLTGEVATLRRAQIERIQPIGSVMPEGLTAPLTPQQLADLVRFLADLGK